MFFFAKIPRRRLVPAWCCTANIQYTSGTVQPLSSTLPVPPLSTFPTPSTWRATCACIYQVQLAHTSNEVCDGPQVHLFPYPPRISCVSLLEQ